MPQPNPLLVLVMFAVLGSILATWIVVLLRFAFEKPILPPSTPRRVPWGAGSVLASILLWFAMQNVAAGIYYVAAKRVRGGAAPVGKASLSPLEMMALSAAGNVATVLAIPILVAATAGARRRDFGFEGPGLARQASRGVLAYPLLAPCVFGLMMIAVYAWGRSPHPLEDAMKDDRSPRTVALLVFAGVVMAPVSEELLFRGVLLGWLTTLALGGRRRAKPQDGPGAMDVDALAPPGDETKEEASSWAPIEVEAIDEDEGNPFRPRQADIAAPALPEPIERDYRVGLLLANMAVSAVFAVLHGPQWPAPVPLFVLSMGLGLLYQRTGSLIGPIALHMTFNGISTLLMFLSAGSTPPADPRTPSPVPGPAAHRVVEVKIGFAPGGELTALGSRL